MRTVVTTLAFACIAFGTLGEHLFRRPVDDERRALVGCERSICHRLS